jgi:hypothetical protein
MDGAENRDFLLASTSSKPGLVADDEITRHEEQDRMEETLQTRKKSLVHVPDMNLDDLELDDEEGQDPDRKPQTSGAESLLRKGRQDSIPTFNNANATEESNEPGKPNSAFECVAADHNLFFTTCHSCHGFISLGSRQLSDLFLPSRA